jgi:hypothetical protein
MLINPFSILAAMAYLLTTARAASAEDITIRERILQEQVQGKYPIGFEVVLKGGPNGDLLEEDQIRRNLERFSSNPNFYLSVHAPLERVDYTRRHTDLTTEQGLETLAKVLKLAQKINARDVVVHSENFHLGKELLEREFFNADKRELRCKVKRGILQTKKSVGYNGEVNIENMPYPLMANEPSLDTIEKSVYDPVITSMVDISYFANPPTVGICLDTAHYGIMKKMFDTINSEKLSREQLKQRGFLGIVATDFNQEQPELDLLFTLFGDALKHLHISDFKGIWIPGKSYFSEGLVPGEGEYEKDLRSLIHRISSRKIPVCLEVRDSDLKQCEQTKKTIEYILRTIA